MLSVREIRNSVNTELRFEGVVLTMFDRRNNLSQQVEKDARENLGEIVFKTVIPRNVRLSEAHRTLCRYLLMNQDLGGHRLIGGWLKSF